MYEYFFIFQHSEDNNLYSYDVTEFVFSFIAKITNLDCYDITNEVTF